MFTWQKRVFSNPDYELCYNEDGLNHKIISHKWGKTRVLKFKHNVKGYIHYGIGTLHTVVYETFHGQKVPAGLTIDHISDNLHPNELGQLIKLNTIENLQCITPREQQRKRAITINTPDSGQKWIYWVKRKDGGKWLVMISKGKARIYVGIYTYLDDAKKALSEYLETHF